MGRALYHAAGAAFVAGVVFFAAKWAFVAGVAGFGAYVWEARPGVEERERRAEQALRDRPATQEEHVREAVNRASTVTLHLIERRWLRAAVEARDPTATAVDLEGVRCRVLFDPDGGSRAASLIAVPGVSGWNPAPLTGARWRFPRATCRRRRGPLRWRWRNTAAGCGYAWCRSRRRRPARRRTPSGCRRAATGSKGGR